MRRGYVKLWRASVDNPMYFSEPFTRWQAWCDLLILANHEERSVMIRGIPVVVGRGQVVAGEEHLAERWKWSRGKVRRYLAYLSSKTVQQIVQQKSRLIGIITIVNYELYQGNGTTDGTTNGPTSSTTNGQQTVQQTDIPKNYKELQRTKKNKSIPAKEKFDIFWEEYPRKVGKGKALESWRKHVTPSKADSVIEAVIKQRESIEWGRENGQFIPHPATWLNQGRWDDVLTYPKREQAPLKIAREI